MTISRSRIESDSSWAELVAAPGPHGLRHREVLHERAEQQDGRDPGRHHRVELGLDSGVVRRVHRRDTGHRSPPLFRKSKHTTPTRPRHPPSTVRAWRAGTTTGPAGTRLDHRPGGDGRHGPAREALVPADPVGAPRRTRRRARSARAVRRPLVERLVRPAARARRGRARREGRRRLRADAARRRPAARRWRRSTSGRGRGPARSVEPQRSRGTTSAATVSSSRCCASMSREPSETTSSATPASR